MYKKETQAIGRLFEKASTQPHPNPNPNPNPNSKPNPNPPNPNPNPNPHLFKAATLTFRASNAFAPDVRLF